MTIPVYAIGATALTGGTEGCLDAVYVDPSGTDPGIADGYVAFVDVQGDAAYRYIADADSGAEADGVNVIKPLWSSEGVSYDGDLRWILHDTYPLKAHAATHTDGTDDIQSATAAQKGLATSAQIAKLDGIEEGAQVNVAEADPVFLASEAANFVAGDKNKLDGVEEGATADQTGAEIKALYEAEDDTNAFTDTEKTKLSGIAEGAEANVNADWDAESGDALILNKPSIPTDTGDLTNGAGFITSGDVPGAETDPVFTASEAANFAAGDKDKLDGIEEGADVTDADNVAAAGAVMETDRGRVAVDDTDRINTALTTDFIVAFINLTAAREYQISSADIASMAGRRFIVKDESGNAGTYNITISTEGAETIEGAATVLINNDGQSRALYTNGSNLFLI